MDQLLRIGTFHPKHMTHALVIWGRSDEDFCGDGDGGRGSGSPGIRLVGLGQIYGLDSGGRVEITLPRRWRGPVRERDQAFLIVSLSGYCSRVLNSSQRSCAIERA